MDCANPHRRGLGEAQGLRNSAKVQGMHIEDVLQLVRVVGQDIGAVSIASAAVKVVILCHQLLELALHIGDLVGWKLVLVQRDLGLLHQPQLLVTEVQPTTASHSRRCLTFIHRLITGSSRCTSWIPVTERTIHIAQDDITPLPPIHAGSPLCELNCRDTLSPCDFHSSL